MNFLTKIIHPFKIIVCVFCVIIPQVSKPNIGETRPSQVRADVTINLNMRDIVKGEWEGT